MKPRFCEGSSCAKSSKVSVKVNTLERQGVSGVNEVCYDRKDTDTRKYTITSIHWVHRVVDCSAMGSDNDISECPVSVVIVVLGLVTRNRIVDMDMYMVIRSQRIQG